MEPIQLVALVIFLVAIGLIIWRKLDRAVMSIIGAALMVLFGVMKETEDSVFLHNAFHIGRWD